MPPREGTSFLVSKTSGFGRCCPSSSHWCGVVRGTTRLSSGSRSARSRSRPFRWSVSSARSRSIQGDGRTRHPAQAARLHLPRRRAHLASLLALVARRYEQLPRLQPHRPSQVFLLLRALRSVMRQRRPRCSRVPSSRMLLPRVRPPLPQRRPPQSRQCRRRGHLRCRLRRLRLPKPQLRHSQLPQAPLRLRQGPAPRHLPLRKLQPRGQPNAVAYTALEARASMPS
jgi:hypothetical protein